MTTSVPQSTSGGIVVDLGATRVFVNPRTVASYMTTVYEDGYETFDALEFVCRQISRSRSRKGDWTARSFASRRGQGWRRLVIDTMLGGNPLGQTTIEVSNKHLEVIKAAAADLGYEVA